MKSLLTDAGAMRLFSLLSKPYRPPEIVLIIDDINASTRVAELRETAGVHDEALIQEIVRKKLQLDMLYLAWVQGEIE